MEMCNHTPAIKIENNLVTTYCKKCGKILDTKLVTGNATPSEGRWQEGLIQDNGGSILHD